MCLSGKSGQRELKSAGFLVSVYTVWIFTYLTHFPSLLHPKAIDIQSNPGIDSENVIHVDLKGPVSLVCTLDSQPDEELVWLRNDAVVQLKEGNKKGHSTVCVTPIYEDNGATFTCYQKENSTVRASVTLNVTCKSL